jgi:hypothetical protein
MQTIRLRVNEKIYKNLMWFLSRFTKEEVHVIQENDEFLSVKRYLEKELNELEKGDVEFLDIGQLDKDLETTIRKYED